MNVDSAISILTWHFTRYTKRYQPDITRDEIEEFIGEWLHRIQAPEDGRGIGIVLKFFHQFTLDAGIRYRLQKIFKFPNWFIPGIAYSLDSNQKSIRETIYNNKMAKGWCEGRPFYVWLFSAVNYHKDYKALSFQLLFIELYFSQLVQLQDPELATVSKTREEEICSASRLLFDNKNRDMAQLLSQIDPNSIDSPAVIANYIRKFCNKNDALLELRNVNYLHSMIRLLLADWDKGTTRSRMTRVKHQIAKRYNKTKRSQIQGNDQELQELLPALSDEIGDDGLEPDDLFPAQNFVVDDSSCEQTRDKRQTTDLARVFDSQLQKRKAVNVTAKVRRGQNVVLQNTELLKGRELALFIRYLEKTARRNDPVYREFVLICWLMLLLGKTFEELSDLFIFDNLNSLTQGLYLDDNGHGWWCFPIIYSAKPRLEDESKGLIQTQEYVYTPCPSFLWDIIKTRYSGGVWPLLTGRVTPELLQQRLKSYSDKLIEGGRVTQDKLTNFMQRYCFASGIIDPVVLDFSYRLQLQQTRVSRSYACLDDEVRQDALLRLWQSVTNKLVSVDSKLSIPNFFEPRTWSELRSSGSIFTPTDDTCQKLCASLVGRLKSTNLPRVFPFDAIIEYHNSYVLYTTYLLMFATGYRAVHNPLPSFALHLKAYGLLAISDKDDADFTHARLVCVPEVLSEQLCHYENHLKRLAELVRYRQPELAQKIDRILYQDELLLMERPTEAANWYQTVRNSRSVLGPLFIFQQRNGHWHPVNISPRDLMHAQPDELQLPANAGRHWIKSGLIKRKVAPEWIDWQMGHWMTGQAPLAYYSAFNHVEVSAELGLVLDEMLRAVGWKSLTSKLISAY